MPEKKTSYEYPSVFGSHKSMIEDAETEKLGDDSKVVLKDEFGLYTTNRNLLDNGMADPNRYATSRLSKLFSRHAASKDEDKQ